MDWFNLPPISATPVDVMIGWSGAAIALLTAGVPGWLAARHALRGWVAVPLGLRLRTLTAEER